MAASKMAEVRQTTRCIAALLKNAVTALRLYDKTGPEGNW
jgi:hypothetical protein